MSFWQLYKSPLGYTNNNNNQIDSYGIDHSGFSTKDEMQYKNARINRENNKLFIYNLIVCNKLVLLPLYRGKPAVTIMY